MADERALWWGAAGVVLLGVASCAVRQPYRAHVDHVLATSERRGVEIPAPTTLEPKPTQLGQWVLYQTRHGDVVGYERFSVVALDGCGIWIHHEILEYRGRWRWTFCVRPGAGRRTDVLAADLGAALDSLQVVISQMDQQPGPVVFDARYRRDAGSRAGFEGIVARLVLPPWRGQPEPAREDLEVPAGRVVQAVKLTSQDGGVTRWWHPAVPFDGMVRELASDGSAEKVLLAYGHRDAASVLPDLAAARSAAPPGRVFASLGIAEFGRLGGGDREASSETIGITSRLGGRVSSALDLIASIVALDYQLADPDVHRSAVLALVAMRWRFFQLGPPQPRPTGAVALYVQAGLGYAALGASSSTGTDSVARGLAGGAAIGALGRVGRDWGTGLELGHQVLILDAGAGTRHLLSLIGYLELYLPWL